MDRSTAHIVPVPGYVTIIRVVQVVMSIMVLGLAGNTISGITKYFGGAGAIGGIATEPLSFLVFCCVWTWLVCAYLIATPLVLPVAYNMWAHLALEVVSWVFWLAGFASTASWASDYAHGKEYLGPLYKYWATSAAAAAFGALIWITFFVTLVVFSLRLHAWRNDPTNAQAGGLGLAEKGGESHQMGVVPPQHVPAPQQIQSPVYQDQAPTPVQYANTPTPVQYTNTPPPQQWQQSPPPPGQQY